MEPFSADVLRGRNSIVALNKLMIRHFPASLTTLVSTRLKSKYVIYALYPPARHTQPHTDPVDVALHVAKSLLR
jgi:hypothetical protein